MAALLRIKATHTPYRRAGVLFGHADWTNVDLRELDQQRTATLLRDQRLHIQVQNPADDSWRTLTAEERAQAAGDLDPRPAASGEGAETPDSAVLLLRETLDRTLDDVARLREDLAARDATIAELQAQVAQLTKDNSGVEQRSARLAHNQEVGGSNPSSASTDTSSAAAGRVGDAAGAPAPAADPGASGSSTHAAAAKASDGQKAGGKAKGAAKPKPA